METNYPAFVRKTGGMKYDIIDVTRLAGFPDFPREREMNLRENSRGKWAAGKCGENEQILALFWAKIDPKLVKN